MKNWNRWQSKIESGFCSAPPRLCGENAFSQNELLPAPSRFATVSPVIAPVFIVFCVETRNRREHEFNQTIRSV